MNEWNGPSFIGKGNREIFYQWSQAREETYSRIFETLKDVIREVREELSTCRDSLKISYGIKKVTLTLTQERFPQRQERILQ